MKHKILAKLVAKYSGLSKEFLGLLATQMATKVTEDSGIDAAIAELDNAPITIETLAAEFQKEGDRRVTEAKKEFTKNPPKPDKTDTDQKPPKKEESTEDEPAWFKKWSEKQEQRIAAIEQDKVKSSMQARRKDKLKDVDDEFYDLIPLPEKDEDFDSHVEQIQNRWNKFNDGKVAENLVNGKKPVSGTAPSKDGKEKEASKEEVDAVMKHIM